MAREAGDEPTLIAFERALTEEADHVEDVRAWVAAAQKRTDIQ
jgi:hypothetical protein